MYFWIVETVQYNLHFDCFVDMVNSGIGLECKKCPDGTFKDKAGNDKCTPCTVCKKGEWSFVHLWIFTGIVVTGHLIL